jgi:hypothetical protein
MGLPPWETSDSQLFALITGANRYYYNLSKTNFTLPQLGRNITL